MHLAILTKAPFPGYAKTRLMPLLGTRGAQQAHKRLAANTLNLGRHSGLSRVSLWASDLHPFFNRYLRGSRVEMHRQCQGDLGERMTQAFLHRPTEPTIVIGTDCPVLTTTLLSEAAHRLLTSDLLTYPAEDGGFVLIGAANPATVPFAKLFNNVQWGGEAVLKQLEGNIRAYQNSDPCVRYTRGATLWDVDTPEDYQRWQQTA